jgi:hypothetical protein
MKKKADKHKTYSEHAHRYKVNDRHQTQHM